MLCDVCHSKEATLNYTVVVGDNATTIYICEDCAKKKGILPSTGFPISGLLVNDENRGLVCSRCGTTFKEFAEKLKFGCSDCYKTFGDEVRPFIKKLQGSSTHKGRIPRSTDTEEFRKKKRIIELKKALKEAIDSEAYETASKIRDELVRLEDES